MPSKHAQIISVSRPNHFRIISKACPSHIQTCLVSEREARDNNQTCRHVSPHAAEWRSLQLLVAVCRILSVCIRVSVCIWTCLHVFARICTYVRVPARICAYLRVSARICEYLPAFARILCVFAPLCLYLHVFVHICTNRWKSCQNAPKKFPITTPKIDQKRSQNPPREGPGTESGFARVLRYFGINFGGHFGTHFGTKKTLKFNEQN